MRITVQEGFITNSSSTTYTTMVMDLTMEIFKDWLISMAEYPVEQLRKKSILKKTLKYINDEIEDYYLDLFLLDAINMENQDLTAFEENLVNKVREEYEEYSNDNCKESWIDNYYNRSEDKWKTI